MTEEQRLIERAKAGDRAALERLMLGVKDTVYNLAIRMLGNRADAEDVSQEIMVRIVTSLAMFRGESAFRTWVYRIASNHLLRARAGQKEQTFEAIEQYLDVGIAADLAPLEDQVLVTEAKLVCTTKMITALDRDHRLAFVLGEILELSSEEGAEVLEISADAFRKRLSRARSRMDEFMKRRCGLVDPSRPCRCAKQAACGAAAGRLHVGMAQLATHAAKPPLTQAPELANLSELERVVAIFRAHPSYVGPETLVTGLKKVLAGAGHEKFDA